LGRSRVASVDVPDAFYLKQVLSGWEILYAFLRQIPPHLEQFHDYDTKINYDLSYI
jgi:hypothetical protein